MKVAFNVARGLVGDFLANLLLKEDSIVKKSYSLVSALSSIGGIFALIFDIADGKQNDMVSIRF